MSENIEFPDPNGQSSAWDNANNRFLTHAEYAALLLARSLPATAAAAETSESETDAPARKRRRPAASSAEFSDALTPIQFKLPADLCRTLKLLSIQQGKSMSELVLEYLTTEQVIRPVWISSRKAS